jgi:hypothetical protein
MNFKTLAEFKAAYKTTDGHFFDKKTMRFFNSRIESGLLKGKYFITSESDMRNENRFYNVREIQEDLSIRTIVEFNKFKSKAQAKASI